MAFFDFWKDALRLKVEFSSRTYNFKVTSWRWGYMLGTSQHESNTRALLQMRKQLRQGATKVLLSIYPRGIDIPVASYMHTVWNDHLTEVEDDC